MKSLTKLTLCILATVLTALSLQFSVHGQIITVSNKQICFDSIAAVEAYNELQFKTFIIEYQDSLINKLELEKSKTEFSYYELIQVNDNLRSDKNNLIGELMVERRERKIWMRSMFGTVIGFMALMIFK